MIIEGDAARTTLETATTTENGVNSVPTASHPLKFASELKIETALQPLRETTGELLDATTHSAAFTVLPDESTTRVENEDNRMLPASAGCPVMLFNNMMSAAAPAMTRNAFEVHDIPLMVN
jgi:hypothetical protein